MTLRKIALLFTLVILIGCNQSDSDSKAPPSDNTSSKQSQSSMNDNSDAVETEPERGEKVLARINGQPVYEDDFNETDLEFLITEEIIYQYSIKHDYNEDNRDKAKDYERGLIIWGAKQRILENAGPTKEVSNEDIKNYYESNKDKYTYVRIQEISFPDSNLGSEIIDKSKSGEELLTIANSYPDLEITVSDIGYNRNMAQHFKTREAGSVSEVIQKPDGTFSVLKIVDVKAIPLNTTKRAIKHLMEAQRKAQMFDSYAKKVAEENNMTIEIIEQDSKQ